MRFSASPATAVVLAVLGITAMTTLAAYVPAMYVFGDSTLDVGNNNYLPGDRTMNKANYHPNGIDYPAGVPTGRFSNGLIGIDFLAKRLGFDDSPPAALSVVNPNIQDFKGLNYASGGSGILDATGGGLSLSMNQQIQIFRKTADRLVATQGWPHVSLFLSRSIFTVSTGNNDMIDYYMETGAQIPYSNDMFVTSLVNQFTAQLRGLYNLGARKFVVFGVGPVGCIPAFRSRNPSGDCVPDLNAMSQKYNRDVQAALVNLKFTLSGMMYSFANTYDIGGHILSNAARFGFTEPKAACCGGGFFNGQSPCLPAAAYCSNREAHLMWDHAHPTQAYYELIANLVFDDDNVFTNPINVEQLAST